MDYDHSRYKMHHADNPGCAGGYVTGNSFAVTCKKCQRWMTKEENNTPIHCTFEVYEASDARAATTPRIGSVIGKGAQVPVGRYKAVLERIK